MSANEENYEATWRPLRGSLAEEAKELGLTVAALKGRLRKKRLHP